MSNMKTGRVGTWGAALALVVAVVIGTPLALAAAQDKSPSRGPIPASVFTGKGDVDRSQIPDYIPALNQNGDRVGWVASALAIPADGPVTGDPNADIPVYADDLSTVVGYMVEGKGFVPLGTDPANVPTIPAVGVTESP